MFVVDGKQFGTETAARAHAHALHAATGVIVAVEFTHMLPQSQEDQEREREDLANLLSCTRWTVDRCRHESCERSALWIMRDGKQIGVIARRQTTGRFPWYAQKLIGGQPVTELSFETLSAAAAYAVRCFD